MAYEERKQGKEQHSTNQIFHKSKFNQSEKSRDKTLLHKRSTSYDDRESVEYLETKQEKGEHSTNQIFQNLQFNQSKKVRDKLLVNKYWTSLDDKDSVAYEERKQGKEQYSTNQISQNLKFNQPERSHETANTSIPIIRISSDFKETKAKTRHLPIRIPTTRNKHDKKSFSNINPRPRRKVCKSEVKCPEIKRLGVGSLSFGSSPETKRSFQTKASDEYRRTLYSINNSLDDELLMSLDSNCQFF